jgi:hypothetical protein
MTARYRNRTAEVEAVQWTGESNCEEVFAFLGLEHPDDEMDHSVIHIDAPGGTATAQHGDWVVRNERGEFGVCTPGLFAAAYEPVSSVGRVPDTSHTAREQLLDALDFSYCLGLGFETPEMLLAAYDASRTVPPAPADRAAVCICGHTEQQHFEDVCITDITGCDCRDFIPPAAAREVIARWRDAATRKNADRTAVLRQAVHRAPRRPPRLVTSVGSAGSNPAEPRINLPAGPPAAGAPTTGRNPMTQPETPADCRRCRHDERTRGVIHLSTFQLYPPDHADDCPVGLRDRIAGLFRSPPGGERLGDATPGEIADAVLAVLSASAGRAAALTEAAARLEALDPVEAALAGQHAWRDAAALLRRLAAEAHDGDTQDDGALRAKVEEATATLRRVRAVAKDWEQRVLPHSQAHRLFVEVRDALAGPRPDDDGPLTEEQIVRSHVTTVHLISEQLATVESWLWERLAEVRAATSAVPPVGSAEPQDETGTRAVCVCSHTRAEHITVSGRLLCDACDPDSTSNLVCRGFDAL